MRNIGTTAAPIHLALTVGNVRPRLMLHNKTETVSVLLRAHRVWQREVTRFICHHLSEGDVFIDVGANIGYFTIYGGLCVGSQGKVHAIEPDQLNARLLAANLALNGLSNVQIHQAAASDRAGEATLFRHGDNAGAHSLLQGPGLADGPAVPVVRLDALLAAERPPKLIKIDVQGGEVAVLRGATGLFTSRAEKPAIILEFAPTSLKRAGQIDALFDFISNNNYSVRGFVANAGPSAVPPPMRRATLREVAKDFMSANHEAEFDLLLLPRQ